MDVLILAGGKGSRLYPLTLLYPKPLLMVNGKPFLEMIIDYMSTYCKRFIICSGYKHSMFDEFSMYYLSKKKDNKVSLIMSAEYDYLGTGGAIYKSRHLINSDKFMVVNGDTYINTDFSELQNKFTDEYDMCEVNDKNGICTGIRMFKSALFKNKFPNKWSLEDYLENKDLNKLSIIIDSEFIDIGTLDDYYNLCNNRMV